jgi:hypothetical protein
MPLKVLDLVLMLLCLVYGIKRTEVPSFMRCGVHLPGIDAVLS